MFLIDSGSTSSFIDPLIAKKLFSIERNIRPLTVNTIHGETKIHESTRLTPIDLKPKFPLRFHLMKFHRFFHGLIGSDVLRLLKADICYSNNTLRTPDAKMKICYHRTGPKLSHVIAKANSATQVKLKVKSDAPEELLIPKLQITENCAIPSCITESKNGEITVIVNNHSDQDIEFVQKNYVPFANLNHFSVGNSVRKTRAKKKRKKRLNPNFHYFNTEPSFDFSLLRTDHLNSEEKHALKNLTQEFSDIFFVEGQPLTFTHEVKHEIRTQDENPIFTKTYRYPQVHKEEVKRQIAQMLKSGIIRPSYSPWSSPVWIVPKKADASGKKKWRMVIDYRKLNDKTVADKYPIPNISDLLDKLGKSTYFTTLDLANGFHQIQVHPNSIQKTAFSTENGHFEFLRMPFGLQNAPSTFQRMMDSVLAGLQNYICLVYLDDIIIFSSSLQEHIKNCRLVFERLRKFNLKIQLDKSEFLKHEVDYLGHVITGKGVKPNPEKIRAIQDFPIPKTPTQIKSFLGLLGYYRKFIKDFSKITKFLTACLKKDAQIPFENPKFIEKFQRCRDLLCNEPILQYPDFSREFILTTDASNFALGAVLSQGNVGNDLPICYASRTLNDCETRYSTIEKELLAIVWATKVFRPYLFGRKFKILTDHRPLTWLFSLKNPESKLARWRIKLEEYDYSVEYKPGKKNLNADALSRIELQFNMIVPESPALEDILNLDEAEDSLNNHEIDDLDSIAVNVGELDTFTEIGAPPNFRTHPSSQTVHSEEESPIQNIPITERAINYSKNQIIFKLTEDKVAKIKTVKMFSKTRNEKTRVVFELNEEGYRAELKSLLNEKINPKLKYKLYFDPDSLYPKITKIIQDHFQNLQLEKSTKLLEDVEEPERQMQIILDYHEGKNNHRGIIETEAHLQRKYYWPNMRNSIQTFINNCETCNLAKYDRNPYHLEFEKTPTPSKPFEIVHMDLLTIENHNFLTLTDSFSKYSQAYLVDSKQGLEVIDKFLVFCNHHGCPKKIVTDKGPEFNNSLLKEFCQTHEIQFHVTSSDHPQSNGLVERFHSTLLEHCRIFRLLPKFKNDPIQLVVQYGLAAYNNSIVNSTKLTPHEIITGHLETEKFLTTRNSPTTQAYVEKHKSYCKKLYDLIHNRLEQNKESYLSKANQKRQKAPNQDPLEVFQRNSRGRKKTGPKFILRPVQQKIDPKTLIVKNPQKSAGEKLRLDQIKRLPRNFVSVADVPTT